MTVGLPVSRVVSVSVSLSALLAQATPINTLLLLGTSTVIDPTTRMREYTNLAEVAAEFGTTAEEYLAAVDWFGQSPQPTTLFIGRWCKTAAAGELVGGSIAPANVLLSAWTGITSGAFELQFDGIYYSITGLNFSAVASLNGVAAVIQTALQAAVGTTPTVVYNQNFNNFIITDSSTGPTSIIGFVNPPTATGKVTITVNPTNNDTITIQGTVVTFVTSGATGNQVNIGASASATCAALATFLNASADANISLMVYNNVGAALSIKAKITGTGGNAYTLARSNAGSITLSGSTLAGGAGTDISAMTAMTQASSGAYQAPGVAAESALAAVTLFDNMFSSQWYGLVVPDASDADHQAIAAYIEGANPPHYYGITTPEAGVLVPGDTTDIGYVLATLKYNKTTVQYSSSAPYAVMSYLARILTTQWLGSNTTITLMYKQEPGIAPETLNTTQANATQAKNVNVYVNYNNNTSFLEYGTSCSGQFTDTVIGADWLAGQVQTNIFNVLFGTPTKIPQTDNGMTQLLNAAKQACAQAVTNAYAAPGIWNSAGFGVLNFGDNLDNGFYVFAAPMATQTEAVRQTRAAPLMQIAVKNAGAIHTSNVSIVVNQ